MARDLNSDVVKPLRNCGRAVSMRQDKDDTMRDTIIFTVASLVDVPAAIKPGRIPR